MKHIIDDADKNKYEAYTKEEVLEVIQEAISSGELPEEINGLVLTFKNPVDNQAYKIAFCTQAKYNELQARGQLENKCYYYITDDTSYDDIVDELNYLRSNYESLDNRLDADEINISGKVDKSSQSGDIKTDIVNSNGASIKSEDVGGDDQYGEASVKYNQVILKVNNDTDSASLEVTDDDITITKDDGSNQTTKSLFDVSSSKTIYTNISSGFPISYNSAGTYYPIIVSEAVNEGDVLEIYCALRMFNDNTIYKFMGRIQIYEDGTLSTPTAVFYPMFNYSIDGKEIGMIEIRFVKDSTYNNRIGVLIRNQGEAGSTEMSSSSGAKLRIEKIVKIIN